MPLLLAALLATAAPVFGPFAAEPLAGAAVRVPDGLPGSTRVLLIAFERERADALDQAWLRLVPLERELAGTLVYQTPVIGEVNAMLRAIVLTSQRMLLPKDRHHRYLPLFVDRQKAMAGLGVGDRSACVAVLARGAAIAAVLPDACAPDLPLRVRATIGALPPLATLGAAAPLPPAP